MKGGVINMVWRGYSMLRFRLNWHRELREVNMGLVTPMSSSDVATETNRILFSFYGTSCENRYELPSCH